MNIECQNEELESEDEEVCTDVIVANKSEEEIIINNDEAESKAPSVSIGGDTAGNAYIDDILKDKEASSPSPQDTDEDDEEFEPTWSSPENSDSGITGDDLYNDLV